MYALLPDLDAVLITFLTNHPSLSPLHGGRVSLNLPAGGATSIRVTAIGGTQDVPWEGAAEYQIECWGGTPLQANTLTRTLVAAIWDFQGPVTGGHINSTVVTLRPIDSPDPTTGRPRQLLQIQIVAHPEVTP